MFVSSYHEPTSRVLVFAALWWWKYLALLRAFIADLLTQVLFSHLVSVNCCSP